MYYLRSLAEDQRKEVADIRKDFPSLTDDVHFPDELPLERMFSSVLRISSARCQMWTHYDVCNMCGRISFVCTK